MVIYAILKDMEGAWESCDVMSIWSSFELADKERSRLLEDPFWKFCEFEIREWQLDYTGEIINW